MSKEQKILAYGLETRTWGFNDKYGYGCAECCNGDRCDEDCTAKYKGRRKDCPHCKGNGFIPESEATLLSQSEKAQGSDTTGDEGSGEAGNATQLNAEQILEKYNRRESPLAIWYEKGNVLTAMEEYKNQASNQTPIKECYVPVTDDEMLSINYDSNAANNKGWFSSPHGWLKKVTLPVTDWEKLEEKFFKECTYREEGTLNKRICFYPEEVWNWIKSNINK
jgi:hypothetical protein